MDIILTILTLLLGIAFVCWGIYQIKTGKMVAKKRKNPIDEPREVGVIFLILGLNTIFYFAPYIYSLCAEPLTGPWIFANEMAIFTATPLAILNTAFFLFISIYAFKEHKILGLKSDKTTKPSIGKFWKPVAIVSLIRALVYPLERILIAITSFSISLNLAEILAKTVVALEIFVLPILLIILCILYLLVYRDSKQPKKAKKVAKTRKK